MVRPLDGVRVLDFTRVLAGPHATRALADLGADVIKLEPPDGDLTRFSNPRINGLATYFVQQNIGKRNISIDLATPRGVEVAAALADRSDVLVENYRTGVMERLGLGPTTLRTRNPRLDLRLRSPDMARPARGSIAGRMPRWSARRRVDEVAVGCARRRLRQRSGKPCRRVHGEGSDRRRAGGAVRARADGPGRVDRRVDGRDDAVRQRAPPRSAVGRRRPTGVVRSFAPGDYLVFTVADGSHVVVSGHPAERGTFELFLRSLGLEQLADDPRFTDVADRLANLEALRELLLEAAVTIPDAAAFEERFAAHRLASGRVRSARELAESEWAAARGAVVAVPDRAGGTIRIPNSPWHFSEAEVGVRGEPRYRGEDNRAVLADVLGYDDATIDELEAEGVLSSRLPQR